MMLLIGYKGESIIRQENGKLFLQIEDKQNAEGCTLVTANGRGLFDNPRPRCKKTVFIGARGGITTNPKRAPGEPETYRCKFTIPIPFTEQEYR